MLIILGMIAYIGMGFATLTFGVYIDKIFSKHIVNDYDINDQSMFTVMFLAWPAVLFFGSIVGIFLLLQQVVWVYICKMNKLIFINKGEDKE